MLDIRCVHELSVEFIRTQTERKLIKSRQTDGSALDDCNIMIVGILMTDNIK
jgi:hypothetical protein